MILDKLFRTSISIIGFPFFLVELYLNQKRYVQPPGQLIQKETRLIHAIDTGPRDAPCSVILDAGMGSHSLDWHAVQSEVSKFARVLTMDRAGFGWSSPADSSYSGGKVVEDYRYLLQSLEIRPPYILVGHSYGSLHMRLFASRFPKDVAALIFVDGVHEQRYLPEYWDLKRRQDFTKSMSLYRIGYILSSIGLPRLLKQPAGRRYLSGIDQKILNYTSYHPKAYKANYQELMNSEKTARQVMNSNKLNNELPITIISSGNKDEVWLNHQQLLCELSNNITHIKTDYGHSIHLENPNLIIDIIKRTVDKVEV